METTGLALNIKRDILGLEPDVLFSVFGFPVASSTLASVLITLVFAWLVYFVIRNYKIIPSKAQVAVEMIYEEILGLVNQITNNSRKHTERLFPIIAAILVYLLFANIMTTLPGIGEITFGGVSLFRAPTTDFNTTIGLALGAVLVLQWVSIKKSGLLGHLGNYFKFKELIAGFKQGIGQGLVAMIEFFVGLLDIIGELAKVISLALRLFGNMYAGQVLMIVIFGAVAYILPAVWLGMGLFVAILQAMVFAALVAAYYMLLYPEADEEAVES